MYLIEVFIGKPIVRRCRLFVPHCSEAAGFRVCFVLGVTWTDRESIEKLICVEHYTKQQIGVINISI